MKINRIYAIVLRFLFLFRHSLDRLTDVFYWPTIDLFIWGLTGLYFQKLTPNASSIMMVIISGILFWLVAWRGQYEITVNLLEELWNKNLINIFVSPLKFSEWITSFLIIGLIKAIMSLAFASTIAFFLYKFRILFFGFYLIPFFLLLIMMGWWVGFFVAGLILRFGTRVQTLAWVTIAIVSPFSAIYYPLSILPDWAQLIAKFVPSSYIFEGIRQVIKTGHISPDKLLASFGLNCIYLALSLLFIKSCFKKVLEKGLIKVY